jgi:hypothetical protein
LGACRKHHIIVSDTAFVGITFRSAGMRSALDDSGFATRLRY